MKLPSRGPLICAGICLVFLEATISLARTPAESLRSVQSDPDFSAIDGIPGVDISLQYASSKNFLGRDLYREFNKAYLRVSAASKLRKAAVELQRQKPGWKLRILDSLRPRSVQQVLWDAVVGTSKQPYVANPAKGSSHNYGFAVDLTLLDQTGTEVDMGTPFDEFSPLAEPRKEAEYLKKGKLSEMQVANRKLLRTAMENAGFIQLPLEWWHFDALPASEIRNRYKVLE